MTAGVPVTDPRVQALVEAHRAHIDRWFYPCSVEMHKALGMMYVADPRFAANLDKTGLAVPVRRDRRELAGVSSSLRGR